MIVNFCITGRLGNAIFRYMASSIICIYYNGTYSIKKYKKIITCSDELFMAFAKYIETIITNNEIFDKKYIDLFGEDDIILNMDRFYQHDFIYKINFINTHPEHYVLTDGVNADDKNCETFHMIDIINTPVTFNKKYKNVLHIRLEDFVIHNLYLKVERIINLLKKNICLDSLCIVCKQPVSEFEYSYIQTVQNYATSINLNTILEHNDTITDYYIMKEAETLICSKSTLSWCAAFFSSNIKKCYLPDYDITPNCSCKYPIDSTELY
jgi:hypothetical protein